MKKQKKQMFLLLAILLVLVLALVALRAYNKAQAGKPVQTEGETIIAMEYEDTELLRYNYEGVDYSFERVDDVWYVADDHSQNVKQYRIKGMLSGVAPLVAEQVLTDVTDYSQYGLEEPERYITFGDDMEQFTIAVGDHNSLSSTYYVRINDSAEVYVVPQAGVTRFTFTLEDLVEEPEEESTVESDTSSAATSELTTSGTGTE